MRLFYALWPDDGTRITMGGEDRTVFSGNGGRMIAAKDYHLTIRFLGEVDDAKLPELEALGERAASMVPASMVELDRVEWWQEPRVLVRSAQTTPEALLRLDELLTVGLKAVNVVVAPRPLKLHLTLARRVKPHPLGTGDVAPLAWPADALSLVVTPGAEGTKDRYRVLGQWPFGGAVSS